MRCAALACIIAGGVLMSGTGAVAFADDGTAGQGDVNTVDTPDPGTGTQPAATPATPTRAPTWPRLISILKKHTIGPISPPEMNLPPWLDATSAQDGVDAVGSMMSPADPRWVPVSVFMFNSAGQTPGRRPPAGRESNDATARLDKSPPSGNSSLQPNGSASPTISFVPLVPRGVRMGPPVTIKNPLPDKLPIDLDAPIVPQLLPTPLLMLVMAIEQQFPLARLLISPIMNAEVPPFIAHVVIPALLSDIVVPTFPVSTPTAAIPSAAFSAGPAALWKPSAPPPLDIAPMGMDMPLAPTPEPPLPPITDWVKLPKPPASNAKPMDQQTAFRAGYNEYLRNAGMAQITAIAVPGAAAILLFAVGGGFIGYRQARAGHVIRAEGIARFLR